MPVTLTVVDNIAAELIERLETLIWVDALTPGAEQTQVCEVIQPTRLGNYTPKDLQIVVMQASPTRVPELDCPGNPPATAMQQIFNIHCHVRSSEEDTAEVDGTINRFAADVRKAVCTPQNTWHTFGGYAVIAEWLTQENIDSGEGTDGINIPLAVTYRTDEDDPYTVRA